MEVGVLLILELDRRDSGHCLIFDETLGDSRHEVIDQVLDFGLPSSLEADEVRDCFLSA